MPVNYQFMTIIVVREVRNYFVFVFSRLQQRPQRPVERLNSQSNTFVEVSYLRAFLHVHT